jgi:[NiFe] hydrogenase assembly HybE family chaperone
MDQRIDRPAASQVQTRAAALEALFRHVAATRMAGVPILHPGLRVEAVGFEAAAGPRDTAPVGPAAVGVLVTPWFMNLVWLPMLDDRAAALDVGAKRERVVGCERFDFIGAYEPGFGAYEACSLFSPMFEFADHAAAVATARAVLDELRRPVPTVAASRRALLFGRAAAGDAGALR